MFPPVKPPRATAGTRGWRPLRAARWPRAWLTALVALTLFAALPPTAGAAVHCSRIAAPHGSDQRGNGSHRRPFRTIHRLDISLRPGQTGCLRAGTYGSFASRHWISKSGTWRHPITIRAYPGEHVKLIGWIQITASHTTLSDVEIDGTNTLYTSWGSGGCPHPGVSAGLSIEGVGDVFQRNDYYQSVPALRGTGIGIGWSGSGDDTVIRWNRIHDVGQCQAYDQLIYLAHGHNVRIYANWLWDDPHGWGVQAYPGPSGAHIYDNVIDAAGSGFTVGGSSATSDNRIDHNVIINSTGLTAAGTRGVAISDYWEGPPGASNLFVANDSYHNPGGVTSVSAVHAAKNITANPDLLNVPAHDFRVPTLGPLGRWGLWNGGLGRWMGTRIARLRRDR